MSEAELIELVVKAPRGNVVFQFERNGTILSLYKHLGWKKSRVSVRLNEDDVLVMKKNDSIITFISRLYKKGLFDNILEVNHE